VREAVGLALDGDLRGLRDTLRDGVAATALVLVALALVHVGIPYPAEIPTAVAGFALGFAAAFPLMLAAWLLSGLVAYAIARQAGRPLLLRVAGAQRTERAERFVNRGGVTGLLAVRLIPLVPFNLICFVCGATRVPLGRYVWTTVLGTAPLTALSVLLGARLQEPSLDDPLLWGVAGALVALLLTASVAILWADAVVSTLVPGSVRAGRMGTKLVSLGAALSRYRARPATLLHVFSWSIAVQLLRIIQAYALGLGLGLTVPFRYYLVFMPVGLLMLLLPISVSGFGAPQAMIVWLMRPLGVPDEQAFALSTLIVLTGLAGNLPGLVLWLRDARGERTKN